jgi:simple sugar transport system permease protein
MAVLLDRWRTRSEYVVMPLGALLVSALLFSLFLWALGKSPADFFALIWRGGFGTWFSIQNALLRAAPLILTALCVALPARLGLVIIGGEGALVIGGLACAIVALPIAGVWPGWAVMVLMVLVAALAGGVWIGIIGALRAFRGVNETIAGLLMAYIAVAILNFSVEGPFRDPASQNKPSTFPLPPEAMVGPIPGLEVHWGLIVGALLCLGFYVLIDHTTVGFAARVTGGNMRAAKAQGLPVGKLIIGFSMLAGAAAGLAGFFEVAAIHGRANASLAAGYGFTGILVAFLARHNPLAILPVALLFGGIAASGGLIQRRMGLPDATVLLMQGVIFVTLLASETLYGRLPFFRPADQRSAAR